MADPHIGLFGINMTADPDLMTQVAQRAEELGYDSVWTGEHIVLPDPQEPPAPAPPEAVMTDTVASLAFLAARTERIKLGTGIIILPQRRPAVVAKSLASLDRLSGGRLLFGLGVGYIPREFEACDTPMDGRGARRRTSSGASTATSRDAKSGGEISSRSAASRSRRRSVTW